MIIISIILFLIVLGVCIYINARLFVYIKKLETLIKVKIELSENLRQSLKELVEDDFLLSDGRLKKMVYKKSKDKIFNGVNVNEQQSSI